MDKKHPMFFLGRWAGPNGPGPGMLESYFLMSVNNISGKLWRGARFDRYGAAYVENFVLLPNGELRFSIKYDPSKSSGGSMFPILYSGTRIGKTHYEGKWTEEELNREGIFELDYIEEPGPILNQLLEFKTNNPRGHVHFF